MEIIDKRKVNVGVSFKSLFEGDAFESEGNYFIKVDRGLAFNLHTNELEEFYNDSMVFELKATITIMN